MGIRRGFTDIGNFTIPTPFDSDDDDGGGVGIGMGELNYVNCNIRTLQILYLLSKNSFPPNSTSTHIENYDG